MNRLRIVKLLIVNNIRIRRLPDNLIITNKKRLNNGGEYEADVLDSKGNLITKVEVWTYTLFFFTNSPHTFDFDIIRTIYTDEELIIIYTLKLYYE